MYDEFTRVCIWLHICTTSLHVCICICIFAGQICMCVSIYIYIHPRRVYVCVYIYLHTCHPSLRMCVCIIIHMDAEFTCGYVCICVYDTTFTCVRVYMFTHIVEAMQARHGPVCLKRLLSRTDES